MSIFGINNKKHFILVQRLQEEQMARHEGLRQYALQVALQYQPRKDGEPAAPIEHVVRTASMIYDFLVADVVPDIPAQDAEVVQLKAVDK